VSSNLGGVFFTEDGEENCLSDVTIRFIGDIYIYIVNGIINGIYL
jgi:hypothetical protein